MKTMLTLTIPLFLQVKLNTDDIYITSVECGGDGTIFISEEGLMYGCGGNKANKLGLDGPAGWLLSGDYNDADDIRVILIVFFLLIMMKPWEAFYW